MPAIWAPSIKQEDCGFESKLSAPRTQWHHLLPDGKAPRGQAGMVRCIGASFPEFLLFKPNPVSGNGQSKTIHSYNVHFFKGKLWGEGMWVRCACAHVLTVNEGLRTPEQDEVVVALLSSRSPDRFYYMEKMGLWSIYILNLVFVLNMYYFKE